MKKILPIGSIVNLKKGEGTLLMIVSRASLYKKDETIGYYDYASVVYPEGLNKDNEFMFFNREDIDQVIFKGFIDSDEQEIEENYDEEIAKSNYPKFSVEDD